MSDRDTRSEQLILCAVIGVIGLVPVGYTLAYRREFGAESIIGLGMLLVAVAGLVTTWKIARRLR